MPERIFTPLRKLSLTNEERQKIQSSILAYARTNPVRAEDVERQQYRRFARVMFISLGRSFVFALFIVLILGAGTSYAARAALPGDPLYGVKVNVNEEVRGWFTFTHQDKANWHTALLTQRFSEATKLAAAHNLTTQNANIIKTQIARQAEAASENAAQLEAEGNITSASSIRSTLEANLQAHAQLLASTSSKESVGQASAPLLQVVQTQTVSAKQARQANEGKLANVDQGLLQISAEEKRQEVALDLQSVKQDKQAQIVIGHDSSIQAKVKVATEALAEGQALLKVGSFTQAYLKFQEASRQYNEILVLVEAREVTPQQLNSTNNDSATSPSQHSQAGDESPKRAANDKELHFQQSATIQSELPSPEKIKINDSTINL